jgi:hypothetical protein
MGLVLILATQETEARRITNPDKKFSRPHLNQWLGTVAYACHPSYT